MPTGLPIQSQIAMDYLGSIALASILARYRTCYVARYIARAKVRAYFCVICIISLMESVGIPVAGPL